MREYRGRNSAVSIMVRFPSQNDMWTGCPGALKAFLGNLQMSGVPVRQCIICHNDGYLQDAPVRAG